MKCADQKGKEKNTCLKEKMGDHASSERKKKTVKGIKEKTERMEKEPKRVRYITDEEGEEYLSEGEDGRPCIKWRRQ